MRLDQSIQQSTITDFTNNKLQLASEVICCQKNPDDNNKYILITKETNFYPLNYRWPDQPADNGTIEIEGAKFDIIDVQTGAIKKGENNLLLHKEISIPKDDIKNWYFLVVHIFQSEPVITTDDLVGKVATLYVDKHRRDSLSLPHTASHLMALALNKSLSNCWKKQTILDGLGNADFDSVAISESTISPYTSVDKYRLGKSLIKKGFDKQEFENNIDVINDSINSYVAGWIKSGDEVIIKAEEKYLNSMRWWVTKIDDKEVKMPCGGTHVHSLAELNIVNIEIELLEEKNLLVVHTTVRQQ